MTIIFSTTIVESVRFVASKKARPEADRPAIKAMGKLQNRRQLEESSNSLPSKSSKFHTELFINVASVS